MGFLGPRGLRGAAARRCPGRTLPTTRPRTAIIAPACRAFLPPEIAAGASPWWYGPSTRAAGAAEAIDEWLSMEMTGRRSEGGRHGCCQCLTGWAVRSEGVHWRHRTFTSSPDAGSARPFRRIRSRRCSAWVASGEPSAATGNWTGVYSTAVGYSGGSTPEPSYEQVCGGRTGHAEVVLVVFHPAVVGVRTVAAAFLGVPRSYPGHAPGRGRRISIPFRDIHPQRQSDQGGSQEHAGLPGGLWRKRVTAG